MVVSKRFNVAKAADIARMHKGELVVQYFGREVELGYITKTGTAAYEKDGRWWFGVDERHIHARKIVQELSFTRVACDIPFDYGARRGFGPGVSLVLPGDWTDALPVLQKALQEYLNSLQQTNSTDTRGVRYGTESKNQVDQHGPEQAR
jgi:hypothetical protein